MVSEIKKKMKEFEKNSMLRSKFKANLQRAGLEDILWPEDKLEIYQVEFLVSIGKKKCPYPLYHHKDRLVYVTERIEDMIAGRSIDHPALAYYYLSRYQDQFKETAAEKAKTEAEKAKNSNLKTSKKSVASKKTARKTAKKTVKKSVETAVEPELSPAEKRAAEKRKEKQIIYNKLQKLKGRLSAPRSLKRARDDQSRVEEVFSSFRQLTKEYYRMLQNYRTLESELEFYRNPDYLHSDGKKKLQELQAENADLRSSLSRELNRAEMLEREVSRLAEQIVSSPVFTGQESQELEELRTEYNILSQKYDAIVSRNIELSNSLEKANRVKSLEAILDNIRERINQALRNPVTGEDARLHAIKQEISQLQRARMYLGKALYDIGIIYLRLGHTRNAISELRAARELGVEDPETNRILNTNS